MHSFRIVSPLTYDDEVAARSPGADATPRRLPLALIVGGVVALAALVFPLIGARWAAHEARRVATAEVYEGQQLAASGVLGRVDRSYQRAVDDVADAASAPELLRALTAGDVAAVQGALADLVDAGEYRSAVVFLDRRRFAASPMSATAEPSSAPGSAASEPAPSIENDHAVVTVRAPVGGGQEPAGELVVTVPFTTLTGGDAGLRIGPDVNVTIISKGGVILATPMPGLEGTRPIAPETLELVRRDVLATKSYFAPRSRRDVLVSFVPDAQHPWSAAASSPKVAELAAVDRLADRIIAGGAVMAALGVLLAALLGVFVGIAERRLRAARAELAERNRDLAIANEDLTAYSNVAAHDLRTPLVTIRGRAEMLPLLEPEVSERVRSTAEVIVGQADRMFEMIDAMLKYSRAGSVRLYRSPVDLNDVARRVLESTDGLVQERGATVSVDALPSVDGDESLLVQLLQNLVENAVRYGDPEHPVVHVRGSVDGDEATVIVRDNGAGVPVAERESIFEMFSRGSAGATVKGGSGIGLALARRIAERHGGTLAVIEDGADPGATFELRLPARAK